MQTENKSVSLKYKLDTTMNPMLYNLQEVLDKDYQNTDDISPDVRDESQELTNYRELKHINKTLIELKEIVIVIKNEHVSSKKKINYMPDFSQFNDARNLYFAIKKKQNHFITNLKLI